MTIFHLGGGTTALKSTEYSTAAIATTKTVLMAECIYDYETTFEKKRKRCQKMMN
jgi:hypothetical protein